MQKIFTSGKLGLFFSNRNFVAILLLGFSSGLPLFLVFPTLSIWLKELDLTRASIGFFSWVTLSYSFKFLWASFFDTVKIPFLAKLFGRDRAWIILCQFFVIIGLFLIGYFGNSKDFTALALSAAFCAFASASQDVAVDGFRIRSSKDEKDHGVMITLYQYGYNSARLISGVAALYIAQYFSWFISYICMAFFMLIGVIGVLIAKNSDASFDENQEKKDEMQKLSLGKKIINIFVTPIINPTMDFINRYKYWGIFILIFISIYRLPDATLVLGNVFYSDLGYSKAQIADVTKIFGLFFSLFGVFLAGVSILRFGIYYSLLIGGIIQAVSNLFYVWLFYQTPNFVQLFFVEPTDTNFIITLMVENISGGFAGTALIAFMSNLTNMKFSATQYALFSSIYIIPGKFIGGFSGIVVDNYSYPIYFLVTAISGIFGVMMIYYLIHKKVKI